jgi:hypothetical protein
MTKTKKGKSTTCLKDASNHQIWWLRFQVLARAHGFDRIIKLRNGYMNAVKDDAMLARMKNARLSKEKNDTGRDGGEDFDTPKTKVTMDSSDSDASDEVAQSESSDDNSSGLESIVTTSTDRESSGNGKKKSRKRTIEQKVARKNRKLYDFIYQQ